MFLRTVKIDSKSLVADIVAQDYRTAEIFRRHGIGYCCAGKWPIDIACEMQGVDARKVQEELETATRSIQLPNQLTYKDWDIDFLMDYLVNIHHHYLGQTLLQTGELLAEFVEEHNNRFPYLGTLEIQFKLLVKELLESVRLEEEILFPYIRQIAHAYKHKEPYAAIFVHTMRKPVKETMYKGHKTVSEIIFSIRELTNLYIPPEKACTSHKVILAKLKELDNDLAQHFYLEQTVLFPKAMAIEKELLNV
ncbi:MAG: DUF542 domain-containing protein [Chitinophagaceae bacterium]